MKYLFSILCFLLSLQFSFAQKDFSDKAYFLVDSLNFIELSKNDSLLILETAKNYHAAKHDTTKLQILENLVDECWNDDVWPRYNLFMRNEAKRLISTVDSGSDEWRRYLYFLGSGTGGIGFQFDVIGQTDSATHYYHEALEYFIKGNHTEGESLIYDALAMIYELKGDMRKALEFYNKALQLAEKNHDSIAIANAAVSLGDLHGELKNYQLSRELYLEAIEAAHATNQKRVEGFTYTSLATDYVDRNKTDSAKILTKIGLKILEDSGNENTMSNGFNMLGNIALFEKKLDTARYYFNEMDRIAIANHQPEDMIIAQSNLYRVERASGNYAKAKIHALNGYRVAKANDFPGLLSRTSKDLAQIYAQQNQSDSAYKYLLEYSILSDSIVNTELKNEAIKQSIEYEYEKQQAIDEAEHEAEMAIAAARESRQNIIIWAVAAILVLISIALVMNFFRLRTIRKQKEALDEAYHQLELSKNDKILASNLKALQAQMNPHFIFNALNSIQTLVLHGDVDSSYDYINKFAMLIRETLNASEQEFIPIEKEIESLQTYLKLEKLRFRDDFNYEINTPDRIPNKYIPPMLIQPFIENALKHGLFHKETDRELDVKITISDTLICVIEDNGIGREASKKINQSRNADHKSYAIGSIKKRLEMMQEKLKTTIGVNYEDLEENGTAVGTRVTIRIPIYDSSSNKTNAA